MQPIDLGIKIAPTYSSPHRPTQLSCNPHTEALHTHYFSVIEGDACVHFLIVDCLILQEASLGVKLGLGLPDRCLLGGKLRMGRMGMSAIFQQQTRCMVCKGSIGPGYKLHKRCTRGGETRSLAELLTEVETRA